MDRNGWRPVGTSRNQLAQAWLCPLRVGKSGVLPPGLLVEKGARSSCAPSGVDMRSARETVCFAAGERWSAGISSARRSPGRGSSAASKYPSVPFPANASASDARPLRRKSRESSLLTLSKPCLLKSSSCAGVELSKGGCRQRNDREACADCPRLGAIARLGLMNHGISACGARVPAFPAWASAGS